MRKFTKRFAAMILAATMLIASGTEAFAATSPTGGNKTPTKKTDTLLVSADKQAKYKKTVPTSVTSTQYKTITFEVYAKTKWKKNVLKGDAKKTTTVIIKKAPKAGRLKAKKFNSKAFKGYKGNIIVKKSAMKKKQFKLLKKKLKKGGFKGKISYQN